MGTQLLAPLNTVHVKYRGFFKDDYKSCCSKPLREVGGQPDGQPPLCCRACAADVQLCLPLWTKVTYKAQLESLLLFSPFQRSGII